MNKIREVKKGKTEKNNIDFSMLVTVIILLCIGLVMVSSASSYHALTTYGNSNELLTKQLLLAIVGVIAMLIISKIDYKIYKKWSYLGYALCLLLLFSVLIPGIGQSRNGARRWLRIGSLEFQPSELMKIVLVLVTATYLSLHYKKLNSFKSYFVPVGLLGAVGIAMFLQKHMSGTLVMCVASFSVILASGIRINLKYIIPIALVAIIAGSVFIVSDEFRLKRIIGYLNPEEDIRGQNWQAAQSLYAIGSGGILGRGLGQSREKYLWLPEAQNDFIFSVLGEELGLLGTTSVLLLFTFFIYRGYRIAITCNDMFGSLVATGITSVFAFQVLINIAVVTCTIPVTGMPLPFFSYGGTALGINLCTMGILLSISRNCKTK